MPRWLPMLLETLRGDMKELKKSHFTTDDVIVPPYLPESRACREELAQYYQSVSRVDYGVGRLFCSPEGGRCMGQYPCDLHL